MYDDKDPDYFRKTRREVLEYVRVGLGGAPGRVFDVGCGSGETLRMIRDAGYASWTGGVELFPAAAAEARRHVDLLVEGSIEHCDLPLPSGWIDCLLCLDVLEHLVDPWRALARLRGYVAANGVLVTSVPNVQHLNVVSSLLRGRWDYADFGLLDRTHLRFFTRATTLELIRGAGFTVEAVDDLGLEPGTKSGLADRLTLGMLRDFFVFRYLVRGRNRDR